MAHAPHTEAWFTSSYSDNQGGQCVQARRQGDGPSRRMAVRDSKNPRAGSFAFEGAAWMDFVAFVTPRNETPL